MSRTVALHPIFAALKKAEDIIGKGRDWHSVNDIQDEFLTRYFNRSGGEASRIPEIESIASWKAAVINEFLRSRGFSIELEELDQDTFGVASVLDLLVEWLVIGEKHSVYTDRVYPGARFEGGSIVSFWTSEKHTHPVARLETNTGDIAYVTIAGEDPPANDFAMLERVVGISESMSSCFEYGGLVMPMVDLDQKVDISWLLQMWTNASTGQRAWISQALQQTQLRLNEKGARVKSGVAIAITLECCIMPKPDLVINKSFYIWFVRDGVSLPFLVGYITPEDWREPAAL